MKRISFFLLASVIVFGGVVVASYLNKNPQIQSTWVWDTRDFQSNQQAYFSFLEEKGVTKLYVQIDRNLPMEQYEAMILEASSKEIAVFAIDGAKDWVYSTDELEFLLEWLKDYQTGVKESARFSGLLLDIEPYLLAEWETDQEFLIRGYQEVIRGGSTFAAKLGIPFEMAIPFWFNEIKIDDQALLDWMSPYINTLVIMSYRTELEGENGLHAIVAPYFKEYQFKDMEIVLTLETESLDGEEWSITFAEKEEADLNRFIKKTHSSYKNEDGYQGISVHHLYSWMKVID
ncbi:hypothetical protein [Halalkalibacter alkalisediminis]|uniref:Amidase n=1 Tax=Halalkalibacter alkalisediminis TaxID=935616 RepID=A0ABV6NMT3_9BACI|nr:hypothetical protein [Halalkalibacter alkalisediminis]